jgi:hypothetical protein
MRVLILGMSLGRKSLNHILCADDWDLHEPNAWPPTPQTPMMLQSQIRLQTESIHDAEETHSTVAAGTQ